MDTHILVWWLTDPSRLSREQTRLLSEAIRRSESVAIGAFTLVEVAMMRRDGPLRTNLSLDQLLGDIDSSPAFRILPLTIEIAKEVSFLELLRDPADRIIVATARVHGLRLLTPDQRIIASNVVSTVD